MNKLSNYTKKLETLQELLIANNDKDFIHGDGKSFVDNEDFPIKHNFSDQLYMREMKMKAGTFVVSAMHHTDHFWFLMTGRILVTTDGETIEHVAPCFEKSIKGAKRLIVCTEDCVFINVHKNPSNTQDLEKIEKNLYSFTIEEYINKEK
jgi:hypothetical protein|tara:strand:+ start:331 stop:780 length:450 start_codon:yes stop_codon:yes gene_type:complete